MATFITDLIGRTVTGFFRDPSVQREVCRIAKRCGGSSGGFQPVFGTLHVADILAYDGTNWINTPASSIIDPQQTLQEVLNAGNVGDFATFTVSAQIGDSSGANDVANLQLNGSVAEGTNTYTFFNIGSTSASSNLRTLYPGLLAGSFLLQQQNSGTSAFAAVLSIAPDQTVKFFKTPTIPAGNTIALGSTLTGYVTGANTSIASSDTVLGAFQKVQGQINAIAATGTGTVSSVGLTVPSVLSVSGSPITSTGTLAVTFATGQTQNQVLASPNGSAGAVGLRALVAADIPTLPANKIPVSTTSTDGYLASADWNTFNSKLSTSRSISTTAPLSGGGDLSVDRTLSIADAVADGTTKGAATFTSTDFTSATGVISLNYTNGQAATGSLKGFLTAADWSIFNNKVSSINSLTGSALTIAVGTTGTDVAVANSGTTVTINIPSASNTARGVVTTAAQTFTGVKTFNSDLNVPGIAMSGKLGVGSGTVVPSTANLYSVNTTLPQFKGAYDASNYITLTTASNGTTTFAVTGTSPEMTFSQKVNVNADFNFTGKLSMSATNTTGGTTGNQTINKPTGTVNIAAAGTTVTVTNSLVTTASIVFAVIRTNDSTATIKNVVPSAGSFVINLSAAATAEISIGFLVVN